MPLHRIDGGSKKTTVKCAPDPAAVDEDDGAEAVPPAAAAPALPSLMAVDAAAAALAGSIRVPAVIPTISPATRFLAATTRGDSVSLVGRLLVNARFSASILLNSRIRVAAFSGLIGESEIAPRPAKGSSEADESGSRSASESKYDRLLQ